MYRNNSRAMNGSGNLPNSARPQVRLLQTDASGELTPSDAEPATVADARIAALKGLALTLLQQVESLEKQLANNSVPQMNLQQEVQRFEAAIIRSALAKTDGRQRRAARLLGVKVTTLNTKIKRLKILSDVST